MAAVLKIQSHVRRMIAQRQYRKLRVEYRAHQEALRLRELEQRQLEKQIGKKKAKDVAERNFQERLEDFQRQDEERELQQREMIRKNAERMEMVKNRNDEPIDDSAVVDDMFGFLEDHQRDNISESQAPSAFRDLPAPKVVQNGDIIMGVPVAPDDNEDLSEYKFQKFAATYFQGTFTHQYSKKPLKHSLLPLQTQGDQLAALALWITILRFMGDLPEPRYHTMDKDNTCVMTKVTATLGRNFIRSKEFQEAQLIGMDPANQGTENQGTTVGGKTLVNGVNGGVANSGTTPAQKEKQKSIR